MSPTYWRDGTLAYRHGEPGWKQKALEVEQKLCDATYRVVARTKLPDGKVVSTVWLGWDHGFFRKGPPIIFETMVFPREPKTEDDSGAWSNLDFDRYATEAEAKAGHDLMVARWRERPQ
jgi:hypothetical protein